MEYLKLGETDLLVSRIGFGCWALGGHGYGKIDDRDSIKAIQKALDIGINFFDTAGVYGFGHSEEILSKALGAHRNNVVIATKFGVNWNEDGTTYKDCSPKRIHEAIEGSLRRLKIECIPLFQIHWYDNKTPISDIMETLNKYRADGKVRYFGCSNFSADLLWETFKAYRVETLQTEFNILKDINEYLLKLIRKFDIALLVYNVLIRGLLSGKYSETSEFRNSDTRSRDDNFRGGKLIKNLQLVRLLKQIAEKYGRTPAQVAIRWVLDNSDVTCAIIGAKTVIQVEENTMPVHWKLDQEDMNIINSFRGDNSE